jgi:hypothetical protein
MIPSTDGAVAAGRHRTAGAVAIAVALTLTGVGMTGCGLVRAVKKVTSAVQANKATIDQFTTSLKSGQPKAFEATYVTTGSSPSRIVYAVMPPKDLAFKENARGANAGNSLDIVVNSSGEYACTPPFSGSGSRWTCQQMGRANAVAQNQILGFYTPAHWVTFLQAFSLAAGFAGDKITTSDLTVNGFSMHCVDFRAPGVPGTSTICTTSQGILGYVKVASQPTSFQLKSYSASPSSSLFQLPRGARVTKLKKGSG